MGLSKAARDHYRSLADRYRMKYGGPVEASEVVAWGMEEGLLALSTRDMQDIHLARLSDSLRSDQDGKGHRLRVCMEVRDQDEEGKPRQRYLWERVQDAGRDFLLASIEMRRTKIGQDIEALRRDVAFYNTILAARTPPEPPLDQQYLDFGGAAGVAS